MTPTSAGLRPSHAHPFLFSAVAVFVGASSRRFRLPHSQILGKTVRYQTHQDAVVDQVPKATTTTQLPPHSARSHAKLDMLFRIFQSSDDDNTSGLDSSQLHFALKMLGKEVKSKYANQMVRKFDVRKTGQLEFDEFTKLFDSMVPVHVHDVYCLYDPMGDSGLDPSQVRDALASFGYPADMDEVQYMSEIFDENKSGRLELLQFVKLLEKMTSQRKMRLFERFDVDQSGGLDQAQLKEALEVLGFDTESPYAGERVEEFTACFDSNKSGQLELLQFSALMDSLVMQNVWENFCIYDIDKSDGLSVPQLRQALESLGVDIDSQQAKFWLDHYSASSKSQLSLLDFNDLVNRLPVAKFWLLVDPLGLIRKIRRRILMWSKKGTSSVQQTLHLATGVGSLFLGSQHFIDVMHYGFAMPFSPQEAMIAGSCHTVAATLGVLQLNFGIAHERKRNSMIWPVPIQNLWCIGAAFSELGIGQDAILSIYSAPFAAFSAINVLLAIWQISESWVAGGDDEEERAKKGIWFESELQNCLAAVVTYTGIFVAMPGAALYLSFFVDANEYASFLAACPEYTSLYGNVLLNTAFLNNYAIFFSTLLKYRIVNTAQLAPVYLLPNVATYVNLIYSFLSADGGRAKDMSIALFLQHQ